MFNVNVWTALRREETATAGTWRARKRQRSPTHSADTTPIADSLLSSFNLVSCGPTA